MLAVFIFPSMLLYDTLGLIRIHILGGGDYWLYHVVYCATSSAVLFLAGKLLVLDISSIRNY